MSRDGALADLLALFLRDDISAWGARRLQRGAAMRPPTLKQLVDSNIDACVQRMAQVRPREPPEVRAPPPRTAVIPLHCRCHSSTAHRVSSATFAEQQHSKI